ncbi:MAG: hypothetical protein EBQ96_01395 [Proteobacteria bacterium]|nr:hypothetical protein [Pseudomonadota bacterium]
MRVQIAFGDVADTTFRSIVSALSEFAQKTTGDGIAQLAGPLEVSVRVKDGDVTPIKAILARHSLALADGTEGFDMLGRPATLYRLTNSI